MAITKSARIARAARALLPKASLTMAVAALAATGGALLTAPADGAGSSTEPSVTLAASVTPLAPAATQAASYGDRSGWSHGYRCEWRDGWWDSGHHRHDRDYGYWDRGRHWHHGC